MTATLLDGGAVVTVDDEGTVQDPGWVLVDDDRIAQVGGGPAPAEVCRAADEVIEVSGCAVMPGMVNGHTHLFQTLFRGLATAHFGDPVIVDQDPPGVPHRALVVDGDHRAAVEEGGGHQGAQPAKPSMTGTMSSMSG